MSTVPAALRDRLEIIELSSYTEDEKVQIAKGICSHARSKRTACAPAR
jgi:ATP-dependent Lon protease